SANALGALVVAAMASRAPVTRRSGWVMFSALAVYGCATLLFGLSRSVVLSLCLMALIGASDMLSTVIRQTLIQVSAPDEMRGRIFAVNTLFVGTAGQLGMFESGVTAAWFGAVGSAVLGGIVVFVTVAIWSWRFPMLRQMNRPDDVCHDDL